MQRINERSNGTVCVKLYDVDGCVYHQALDNDPKNVATWLIKTNQDFLDYQVTQSKEEHYSRVIIGLGTNRQSFSVDHDNLPRGGSCLPVLPILQKYWAAACPQLEVYMEPFMMADIYGSKYSDKAAGDSYQASLRGLYQKTTEDHAFWMFDYTKVSIIYAHAHRVAVFHPDQKIIIDFYDDRILDEIIDFYQKYPELLPENVTLRVSLYNGGELKLQQTIPGKGMIDYRYEWSVRLLSAFGYYFSNPSGHPLPDKAILEAEQLKQYHMDRHYFLPDGRRQEMGLHLLRFEINGSIEAFKKFQREQYVALPCQDNLTKKPTYTTCAELLADHAFLQDAIFSPTVEVVPEVATPPVVATRNLTLHSLFAQRNDRTERGESSTPQRPWRFCCNIV